MFPNSNPDEPADTVCKEPEGESRARAQRRPSRFAGAKRISVPYATLEAGHTSPERPKSKVYRQKSPETLIRITGRPPLEVTAYELEQTALERLWAGVHGRSTRLRTYRKLTIHLKSDARPFIVLNDSPTLVFGVSHFHISSPVAWPHLIIGD